MTHSSATLHRCRSGLPSACAAAPLVLTELGFDCLDHTGGFFGGAAILPRDGMTFARQCKEVIHRAVSPRRLNVRATSTHRALNTFRAKRAWQPGCHLMCRVQARFDIAAEPPANISLQKSHGRNGL